MDKKSGWLHLFFTVIIFSSCSGKNEDAVSAVSEWRIKEKTPVAVETVKVKEEPFFRGIESSGIVEGIREADVISETAGIIKQVFFEIGRYVEKGDLLLTVENSLAASSLDYARQEYRTAQLEFEAVEKSFNNGGTSLVAYNQSKTKRDGARLRVDQARETFENTELRAPFSGFVSSRSSAITAGSYLSRGVSVTHIVDTTSFQVRLSLGEGEVSRVTPGEDAAVFINVLPDLSIPAEVITVSPGSIRSSGSFPVVVQWKNRLDSRIKSGMSSRVILLPGEGRQKELVIPLSAVVYRDGESYIFRVRNGAAEAVEVEIGRPLGDRVSVHEGLSPGDQLITSGLFNLAPGDPVLPEPVDERSR